MEHSLSNPVSLDLSNQNEWRQLTLFLPKHWRKLARQTKAVRRQLRELPDTDTLLRLLLMHLSSGSSLRETAAIAKSFSIANTSDVALLKRLRVSAEWFRQLSCQICAETSTFREDDCLPFNRPIKLIDGSVIHEPGATGSSWRLHYALDLHTLSCSETIITDIKRGESLTHHAISPGDLIMADRGYATRKGLQHVVKRGGDVLLRINLTNLPISDEAGAKLDLLPLLRTLDYGEVGSWPVWVRTEKGEVITQARVCAYKKLPEQAQESRIKSLAAAKGKHERKEETLEASGYVIVLTTLKDMAAKEVMKLYRKRWQIELSFKRLKSLLHIGHLRKYDPDAAKAWLQGKLLIACLIEKLLLIGERFSPWGYIEEEEKTALKVARVCSNEPSSSTSDHAQNALEI